MLSAVPDPASGEVDMVPSRCRTYNRRSSTTEFCPVEYRAYAAATSKAGNQCFQHRLMIEGDERQINPVTRQ